jgi:hypothetical protein
MNFQIKNVNDVNVVSRKNRTSKYEPLIKALTSLEGDNVVVVNCEDNQTAEQLRQNIYQGLRNQKFDISTMKISLKEDQTGIVFSKKD